MKSNPKLKTTKSFIKFLALYNNSPKLIRHVINEAPDSVIKAICNAALNALYGDSFKLSDKQKRALRRHRSTLQRLSKRNISLASKRKSLTQKGSGFGAIIPILLSTALGVLGPLLFNKK